ncbi:unnamed protein product [Dicrocoelium dendriticum]|nr:unnamed protein product [Dicrocoelium dendriticum]
MSQDESDDDRVIGGDHRLRLSTGSFDELDQSNEPIQSQTNLDDLEPTDRVGGEPTYELDGGGIGPPSLYQANNNADERPERDEAEDEEAAKSSVDAPHEEAKPQGRENQEGASNTGNLSESDSKMGEPADGTEQTVSAARNAEEDGERDADMDEGLESESEAEMFRAELKPKQIIDPNFTYNRDEAVSKPMVSENSGIPEHLLSMFHSFGYDALRRENLQLLEPDVVCYVTGNYLEILNLTTDAKRYLRTIMGLGIGAFCAHTKQSVIAIAEKGDNPPVCIYRYPELDLYRILSEGTLKEYSACQFSPDGELIATVGSDPDYMLTLWEWRNEQIVLRSKAFSQDIYRVAWSADLEGILTTAGAGHIRFWKMANTFTGLKLQGKLGKFGKTELSDIEGFVTLPDGKVLTGSSWGNLLVWEGDLIKVQISRKNKRPCHSGLVMHIVMDEGELMTIGQDGWIRTWDFETVDTAECIEEGAIFELEPMNELQVSPQAKLIYLVKSQDEESTCWFAQDGDGVIWKLDLSFSHTSTAPEPLVKYHSGGITDCCTSPFAYTAATIGMDGRIIIYDLVTKKSILRRQFPTPGTKLIWSPPQVDPKGKTLVAGFQDGVVRVLQFGENPETDPTRKAKHFALLDLGQALKPHTGAVNSMAFNESGDYFVTGSEDETIFFFAVRSRALVPIGFVSVGAAVVKVEWIPPTTTRPTSVAAYLKQGCILTLPYVSLDEVDQSKSFALPMVQPNGGFHLLSIKSRLLHEEEGAEKLRRYEIEKQARQELRAARAEREPETEEDAQRLDEEEELIRQGVVSEIADWAPTYPEKPSTVLYGCLDPNDPNEFWLSTDDYDCGYLYKCTLGKPPMTEKDARLRLRKEKAERKEAQRVLAARDSVLPETTVDDDSERQVMEDSTDPDSNSDKSQLSLGDLLPPTEAHASAKLLGNTETPITYWTFSATGNRLFVGMKDGCVRVQLLERPFDITSLKDYWVLRMHDNTRGAVNKITLTHDEKFLLSIGQDGTMFVCDLMTEDMQNKEIQEYRARIPSAYDAQRLTDDIVDPKAKSIEQSKQKEEHDRLMNLVEQKKAEKRKKISELRLRFRRVKEMNEKLPERLRLKKEDFDLVPQIRADLLKERAAKIELVYRDTAWMSEKHRLALAKLEDAFQKPLDFDRITVRAFTTAHSVSSIRTNQLNDEHMYAKAVLEMEKMERMTKAVKQKKKVSDQAPTGPTESKPEVVKLLSDSIQAQMKGVRGLRVARKLHMQEEAQRKRNARQKQWEELLSMKPVDDYEDPEDIKAITEAKENMGDFKLKSAQDYIASDRATLDAFGAKWRLFQITETAFQMRHDFNTSVLALKTKKMKILEELQQINVSLRDLQGDLPADEPILQLELPTLGIDEHPEQELVYNKATLLKFKKEKEGLAATETSHNPPKPQLNAPTKSKELDPLVFSESIPLEHVHTKEPDVESGSLSTDGVSPRTLIRIPLHSLRQDRCVFSLTKDIAHCALMHPPLLWNVGDTEPTPTEPGPSFVGRFNGKLYIRTSRKMRPDTVSVALMPLNVSQGEQQGQHQLKVQEILDTPSSLTDNQRLASSRRESEITRSSEADLLADALTLPESSDPQHKYADEKLQRRIRAEYQRQELLCTAGRLVRCFDAEVRMCRHTRFHLDVLLKRAELHQLTLFEEYRLLKEFEKSEMVLTEKKSLRDSEKQEVNLKIAELNTKIDARKKELERLAQKEHALHEEFKASLGEGHRFTDFLTKVFKKRIKRKKADSTDAGSSDTELASSSSEDSSFDESEEESDEEDYVLDLDVCPAGCPQEDFDNTCAIRERRLDVEDETIEEKKALELLKKDLEGWVKKQRIVEVAQKQAKTELEAFQLEKQRKLNELDTIVILRLNQIEYHANSTVPADMSSGLVFKRSNLQMLYQRIRELQEEKKHQRREQLDAKDRHVMLQKHKKLFLTELEKLTDVCDREMVEKFGKIDDLEKMEGVIVNPKLEELTTKMFAIQEQFERAEMEMEERIREARDTCIDQLRENTTTLTQTLLLYNEKERLQTELNRKQGSKLGVIDTSDNQLEHLEIERLTNLVKAQEDEIAELSNELRFLRRMPMTNTEKFAPRLTGTPTNIQ